MSAIYIYIYIYIQRKRERERFEGITINQSYIEGEKRTVLVPSPWLLTVPRTPPFSANSERLAGGWTHVMNWPSVISMRQRGFRGTRFWRMAAAFVLSGNRFCCTV